MEKKVKTYVPKKVIVTFGTIIGTGFAEGTFIKITRTAGNLFDKKKGADGSIERIHKAAYDFTVELTFMQTSVVNDALSGVVKLDEESGLGVLPLVIKDLSGRTVFFADQAWIEKDPDPELADSTTNRTWVLATGPADKWDGGNN